MSQIPGEDVASKYYEHSSGNVGRNMLPCSICKGIVSSVDSYWSDVSCCWDCKDVFKQCLSSKREFRCLGNGDCPITRITRFHCFYCFVKNCIQAGFASGCVWQQGPHNTGYIVSIQNPPRETAPTEFVKQRQPASSASSDELEPPSLDVDVPCLDHCNTIFGIAISHASFCETTTEKSQRLLKSIPPSLGNSCPVGGPSVGNVPDAPDDRTRFRLFQVLLTNMGASMRNVAEFLKRLPGFDQVSLEDEVELLKVGFFEIWLLWHSGCFVLPSRQLVLEGGHVLSFLDLSSMYSTEFAQDLFEFARFWSALSLNDAEVGLFAGILLTTVEGRCIRLQDEQRIRVINDGLRDALQQQLFQNYPDASALMEKIFLAMPVLESINCSHADLLNWYRNRWHCLKVAPLLAEVLEFPLVSCKSEEGMKERNMAEDEEEAVGDLEKEEDEHDDEEMEEEKLEKEKELEIRKRKEEEEEDVRMKEGHEEQEGKGEDVLLLDESSCCQGYSQTESAEQVEIITSDSSRQEGDISESESFASLLLQNESGKEFYLASGDESLLDGVLRLSESTDDLSFCEPFSSGTESSEDL